MTKADQLGISFELLEKEINLKLNDLKSSAFIVYLFYFEKFYI